jgi:transmembrane 9 superfamily protein 2/4
MTFWPLLSTSADSDSTSEVYVQNEPIKGLKVNKLSSSKTQLPYEFYSLPYCRPEKIISSAENLGEVLRGDRIVNSLYEVR